MMRTDELDFELPPELIAQVPTSDRAASRLLHYQRSSGTITHRTFSDLPSLLKAGDLLVFNDSRVIPARLALRKSTGGLIEGLFLAELQSGKWRVMLKNAAGIRADHALHFSDDASVEARIEETIGGGEYVLTLSTTEPAARLLSRLGRMPLPPYIKRAKEHDDRDDLDRERYQTVYAHDAGSVAAPTAGLHFTPEILGDMKQKGIEEAFVTLHVGMGTFKPVTADTLEDHVMHEESYTISPDCAATINAAKRDRRRIITVGTTATRVLESQPPDEMEPESGSTGIFIYPPYQWKHVSGLITNFHLPRSTLIALVAAMTGLEAQRRIYREAIEQRYRFFSYGDAMFID